MNTLLKHRARNSINEMNKDGSTALVHASDMGHTDSVNFSPKMELATRCLGKIFSLCTPYSSHTTVTSV